MEHAEREYWARIQDAVPGFKQRIETSTSPGVPDVYGCFRGKQYWMELKVWQPGTGVLIRKEQFAWAANYTLHEGLWLLAVWLEDALIPLTTMICEFEDIRRVATPYGTQEKYVVVRQAPIHAVTVPGKKALRDALTKKLFT